MTATRMLLDRKAVEYGGMMLYCKFNCEREPVEPVKRVPAHLKGRCVCVRAPEGSPVISKQVELRSTAMEQFKEYEAARQTYLSRQSEKLFGEYHSIRLIDPSQFCQGCGGPKPKREIVHDVQIVKVPGCNCEPCPYKDKTEGRLRRNYLVARCGSSDGSDLNLNRQSPRSDAEVVDTPVRGQGLRRRGDEKGRRHRKRQKEAAERSTERTLAKLRQEWDLRRVNRELADGSEHQTNSRGEGRRSKRREKKKVSNKFQKLPSNQMQNNRIRQSDAKM